MFLSSEVESESPEKKSAKIRPVVLWEPGCELRMREVHEGSWTDICLDLLCYQRQNWKQYRILSSPLRPLIIFLTSLSPPSLKGILIEQLQSKVDSDLEK